MTSGFYEQLGIDAGASAAQVRAAYTHAVSKLMRRRKSLVDQGGDPAPLDLVRQQLDEGWAVLSDPMKRRKYDAMLAWKTGPDEQVDPDAVWEHVSEALVHPAAAAAVNLLRVITELSEIGEVAQAPLSSEGEPPTLVPADEDLTAPRIPPPVHLEPAPASEEPAPATPEPPPSEPTPPAQAPPPLDVPPPQLQMPPTELSLDPPAPATPDVVVLPTAAPEPPDSTLRVVDGSPDASDVIVLPSDRPRRRTVSAEDIARLVDEHGHSGALLRAVRDARAIALQEMADATRISVRYLEAIEADDYAALPSATFVRGYVREMAKMLRIDHAEVVAGYMQRFTK